MDTPVVGDSAILRVLVIEASEAEAEKLLNALRGGGHAIYARHVFGAEALSTALFEERWSIVLLNCDLPDLPAGETLDTIRVADRDVPVILVINRGSRFMPAELLESGAQDFVLKSNLTRLLPVVERECVNGQLRRDGEKVVLAVREAASAMGESEARFLQLAGNIPECFWLIDAASEQVTYVSKGYEQIWGRYVEALYADPADWTKYLHEEDRDDAIEAMRRHRRGGLDIRFRVIRPDGTVRWLHVRNFPIRNDDGHVVSIGGLASDITTFFADNRQLAHLARFDALTALPNQIAFYDRLQSMLGMAKRNGMHLAVMVIDIDRFRTVNETLGHLAGDEFLRQLAGRLSGSLREGDTVGRLGGDVFAAILADTGEPQQSNIVARRVAEMLAMPVRVDGHDLFATASIGIAFYPQDGAERHELVQNAQSAMRRAKGVGRNSVQYFAPAMQEEERDRLFFEVDLRNAAIRNEFILVYQPKVSCASGRIIGAEALLRWRHPRRGIIAPDQFIPMLEETGLIIPVGRWAMQTACAQLAAWRQAGLDIPNIAVNLSARQLQSDSLCDDIEIALAQAGLPASCLDLEITESMLMQQPSTAVRILDRIKALGVTLSLDDFGTGYSSLAYLKRFPIDTIKVDRSFVQDITADSDDASITRAVITMAHHLKLKVVAEGVETEGQLTLLISHQCDAIQGYYFARPLPAIEMEVLLREERRLPPNLLKSATRQPMALLVGVRGHEEDIRQLERQGHRVCLAATAAAASEWFAANLADVVVCGAPRRGFDALAVLAEAAASQPQCERYILASDRQLGAVGRAAGTAHRVLKAPLPTGELCRVVEEALHRRQIRDDFDRLADEAEVAARQLVVVEEQRRRLEEENRHLLARDRNGYAILQSVMHELPWPAFGVDEEGMLALVNEAGMAEFSGRLPVIGSLFSEVLPEAPAQGESGSITVDGVPYLAWWRHVDIGGELYGHLLFLQRGEQ